MSTGYAYRGACFPTSDEAISHACIGGYPESGSDAAGPYSVSCTGVSATDLQLLVARPAASAVAMTLTPAFASCETEDVGNTALDGGAATAAFTWGFCFVVFVYMVASGCGEVLSVIGRRD